MPAEPTSANPRHRQFSASQALCARNCSASTQASKLASTVIKSANDASG